MMLLPATRSSLRGRLVIGGMVVCYLLLVSVVIVGGCAPNDPFDPNSVKNSAPVASFFVEVVDPDGEVSPTSYFNRTFRWSGSDRDGWVVEYYVSIRTETDVPAPWDTTTRTDTTMTFTTDEFGEAEATLLIACKDNRGAYSDTISKYLPLKNFPPSVGFQSDYNPLTNLQRDYIYDGEAIVDTVYWNYGPNSFRLFALDLDGAETMDDFYRYTLMDTEPETEYETDDPLNDPLADPETSWIKVPFGTGSIKDYQIFLRRAAAGQRTLTVSVGDEADADTRFTHSWEVRNAGDNVLYMVDNASEEMHDLAAACLDDTYGEGQWGVYGFPYSVPDNGYILLETMRLFESVWWCTGNQLSPVLQFAAERDGVLDQYVDPAGNGSPHLEPGKLLVISPGVIELGNAFLQDILGVSPTTDPRTELEIEDGHLALGAETHLPSMISTAAMTPGVGLVPYPTNSSLSEALYNMEECVRCYSSRPRWDPVIAIRKPTRQSGLPAQVVTFSVGLHGFDFDQTVSALQAVLVQEMGVEPW